MGAAQTSKKKDESKELRGPVVDVLREPLDGEMRSGRWTATD